MSRIKVLNFVSLEDNPSVTTNLIVARIGDKHVLRFFHSGRVYSIPEVLRGNVNHCEYTKIEFDSFEDMRLKLDGPVSAMLNLEWTSTDAGFGYGISERELNQAIRDRY